MRLIASPPSLLTLTLLLSAFVASPAASEEGLTAPSRNGPECLLPDGSPNPEIANEASTCPDLFAWRKFVQVNTPAPTAPGHVLWQGWATDLDTFPLRPDPAFCAGDDPDPTHCPSWPLDHDLDGQSLPSKRNDGLHSPMQSALRAAAELSSGVPPDQGALASETIHRNRTTFDYIVDHELWYQEGLDRRIEGYFEVDFPADSIELKVNWLPARYVPDPSRYLFAEKDGELHVMVAMHISTKDLPDWFWATFEHVDNPGRCDHIGCWDSFGVETAVAAPRRQLKQPYPADELTPALETMMLQAGLDWVLRNYRLKGTQVDFTDEHGKPTILGNSVTEYGVVPTASCIACHGRAGFDFVWAIPFRAQPIGGRPPEDVATRPTP